MAALPEYVEGSHLTENCKLDLINHVNQLKLHCSLLPKRPLTMADDNLPPAVLATTVAMSQKAAPKLDETARQRFLYQKQQNEEAARNCLKTLSNKTYFKKYTSSYLAQRNCEDPFVKSRRRDQLSGKDMDFVRDYAEALTHSKNENCSEMDDAKVAAAQAYRLAFRRCANREPTEKEMREVDRIHFGFDEQGNIGVIQKPHTCYEHSHITSCNRRVERCDKQIYVHEKRFLRSARDRFPGPIPVWSSTKNTYTMVAGDMHQSGHYRKYGVLKKSALPTIVGSK